MNDESGLQLKRLPSDEDDIWHVVVTASNGSSTASQEVYLHPQQVEDYAKALLDFPRSREDSVELEIGHPESKWAHYVLLRAFLVDSVGHSAIWVVTSNNREDPRYRVHSEFSITELEPAQINALGKALLKWLTVSEDTFRWRPKR